MAACKAEEIEEVIIETDREGIVIKADSLGSLEAMVVILNEKNIPIKKASIGNITKKDISEAESNLGKDDFHAAVLGFNVEISQDAKEYAKNTSAKIMLHNIIYRLIEDFENWVAGKRKENLNGNLDMVHFLTGNHKLTKYAYTSLTKRNIFKSYHSKQNISAC